MIAYIKVFTRGDVKLALISSDKKSVSSESSEYLLNMGLVFGHIARVDKNVVQVDDDCDINHICKSIIHKSLKGCGCIGKPFRHYRPLKRAVSSSECSFPFVSGCNLDQVVCMSEIDLGVNLCLSGVSRRSEMSGSGYWSFFGNLIESSKIDAKL